MEALRNLIVQDNNIILVHNLKEALVGARISLLKKLWDEIDCELSNLRKLPPKAEKQPADKTMDPPDADITKRRIERFVKHQRNSRYHGLFFKITDGVHIGVQTDDSIVYGVRCWKKNAQYDKFKKELQGLDGGCCESQSEHAWPWICLKPIEPNPNLWNPKPDDLKFLADEQTRKKYVEDLVVKVGDLWEYLCDNGLASRIA